MNNTSFVVLKGTKMAIHIFPFVNLTNGSTDYKQFLSSSEDNIVHFTSNENSLLLTRLIVQKLCVPLVVITGVIGNSLCIIVLTRKCMKSSTNSYLTALAVFDLLYLIFSFTLSLKHYDSFTYSIFYVHWFRVARVFADMFANVSVILTVTFTVERYIGVCHPMKGRILCTSQRAKLITAIVSTIAILCTAPEFWEMEVLYRNVANITVPVAVYTEFANQPSYEVCYYWFLVVVFTLLPLVLLCVFNGILIATVISAAKLRKEMTLLTPVSYVPKSKRVGHSQPKEQQKITKMLITVVVAFIICQLPGAMLLLVRTYTSLAEVQLSRENGNNIKIAANVTNLLIQTNASINFILYSAISTKFRRVFYRSICKGRTCLRFLEDRSNSNYSRSDGVQMSSFYGDKLGNRTSCSTYMYKMKVSQKSLRPERSPIESERASTITSRKQRCRHVGPIDSEITNENNGALQNSLMPRLLSKVNRSDDTKICDWDDSCKPNCACSCENCVCFTKCYENSKNELRISWRGDSGSNLLWTDDNLNR